MQGSTAVSVKPVFAVLAGFCSNVVGIGLARFAYTPLIPALIEAGWFAPGAVAYLGAANLAGYLIGALSARWVGARAPLPIVLRTMMLLAAASFIASAAPINFAWFFVWRFASGLAGGVLMVLAATSILQFVPAARRGLAAGAIFTGVGVGIIATGTLVPMLLNIGLAETWLGLGALALLLTAVAWRGWPREVAVPASMPAALGRSFVRPAFTPLKAIYAEYTLCAIGFVPHMVFLVDFIARGLGQGVGVGAQYWVLFGLGAAAGPMLAGTLADRIGFTAAVRVTFLVQTLAVALLVVGSGPVSLAISSIVVGACVPGVGPLVLGRVMELAGPDGAARKLGWSIATTGFAVGQAIGGYGFSYLFAETGGGYQLLFALGAGSLVLALLVDLAAGAIDRQQRPAPPAS